MDLSHVVRPADFQGDDEQDRRLCRRHVKQAVAYISSFDWCRSVKETYVGDCVGGIIALVLVRIEPSGAGVDEWLWVVEGDLPSAYIAPASPDPREALEDYIEQMSRWVSAVKQGRPVTELIPVNTPPTTEWADALERRLDFLKEHILPDIGQGNR